MRIDNIADLDTISFDQRPTNIAMIGPAPETTVIVATRPVDFEKVEDPPAALVAADYGAKP